MIVLDFLGLGVDVTDETKPLMEQSPIQQMGGNK